MINHAPKTDEEGKKNPIYFLCFGNSCRKRSKGTDKEMTGSTSSHLHVAPCEKGKITLKLLPWWKKRVLCLMHFSRGEINSINESEAERHERTFVWENLFWLKNESAIWWQRTKQRFPVNGCEQHSDDRRVTHIIWMEALSQLQSGKLNTLPQHDHQRLRSPNVFHLNRRKLKKKSENTWRMSHFVIFKITVVILQTNGINCNEL